MKLFSCDHCGQTLYFENTRCERCAHVVGYDPQRHSMLALEADDDGLWRAVDAPERRFRNCANAQHDVCNWLVPAESADAFCAACRFNRTIPNLDSPVRHTLWQRIEAAKHRLVYAMMRLDLPLTDRRTDPVRGLAFDFVADSGLDWRGIDTVVTGHEDGQIVIDLAEADDAERERNRQEMAEPYRTLLGHFRHEIGHFYWMHLVGETAWQDSFRKLFGDERESYAAALERHYENGPPDDWQSAHVSAYATSHPWEDFAETWAHYLLIVDTLETAHSFALSVAVHGAETPGARVRVAEDPYADGDFDAMMKPWAPMTTALNSLNESAGQPDLYPFVLAPAVMGKLRFIHALVHDRLRNPATEQGTAPAATA